MKDLIYSDSLGATFLTNSSFIEKLISLDVNKGITRDIIVNLSLTLDVPVFENASIDEIIDIRTAYGESFESFRTGLGAKLLAVDTEAKPEKIKSQLTEISCELKETYINNINRQINLLCRHLGMDVIVLSGSLLSSYVTGGLSMVGAAAATIDGIKESMIDYGNIKASPGYFIWKVNKSK